MAKLTTKTAGGSKPTLDEQRYPMIVGRWLISAIYAIVLVLIIRSAPNLHRNWNFLILCPISDLFLNFYWWRRWEKALASNSKQAAPIEYNRLNPLQLPFFLIFQVTKGFSWVFKRKPLRIRLLLIWRKICDFFPLFKKLRALIKKLPSKGHCPHHHATDCVGRETNCPKYVDSGKNSTASVFCAWPDQSPQEAKITVNRQRFIASHFAWDFVLMSCTLLLPNPRVLIFAIVFMLIISVASGNLSISKRVWFGRPFTFFGIWAWLLFFVSWVLGLRLFSQEDVSRLLVIAVGGITLSAFWFCDYLATLAQMRWLAQLEVSKEVAKRGQQHQFAHRTLAIIEAIHEGLVEQKAWSKISEDVRTLLTVLLGTVAQYRRAPHDHGKLFAGAGKQPLRTYVNMAAASALNRALISKNPDVRKAAMDVRMEGRSQSEDPAKVLLSKIQFDLPKVPPGIDRVIRTESFAIMMVHCLSQALYHSFRCKVENTQLFTMKPPSVTWFTDADSLKVEIRNPGEEPKDPDKISHDEEELRELASYFIYDRDIIDVDKINIGPNWEKQSGQWLTKFDIPTVTKDRGKTRNEGATQ